MRTWLFIPIVVAAASATADPSNSPFAFNKISVTPTLARVVRHLISKDRDWMLKSLARERGDLVWAVAEGSSEIGWRDPRLAIDPALARWLKDNHPGLAYLAPGETHEVDTLGPRGVIFLDDTATRGSILELYVNALIEDELAAHQMPLARILKELEAIGTPPAPGTTAYALYGARHALVYSSYVQRKTLRRFDAAQFVLDLYQHSNLTAAELRPVLSSANQALLEATETLAGIVKVLDRMTSTELPESERKTADVRKEMLLTIQKQIATESAWLFDMRCELDLSR